MDDSEERSDGISVEPVGWQNGESRVRILPELSFDSLEVAFDYSVYSLSGLS